MTSLSQYYSYSHSDCGPAISMLIKNVNSNNPSIRPILQAQNTVRPKKLFLLFFLHISPFPVNQFLAPGPGHVPTTNAPRYQIVKWRREASGMNARAQMTKSLLRRIEEIPRTLPNDVRKYSAVVDAMRIWNNRRAR